MLEKQRKFYLYDRWFYFKKEKEDKITYQSSAKKKTNYIEIVIDKNTNDTDILYIADNKLIAKLEITEFNSNNIRFHYQEQEPQYVEINDELYANLLIELFTSSNEKLFNKKTVKITKKRKKNDIVYREPEDFKLDKEISYNKLKIKSKVLDYFINIIDYIKNTNDLIDVTDFISSEDIVKETFDIKKVKNLEIPNELYVYDRNYTFVGRDEQTIYYENEQTSINKLEIKIDPNNYISAVNLRIKNKTGDKNTKYVFQIIRNELNGITVRFGNKNGHLRITSADPKDYDNATFRSTTIYGMDNKKISHRLDIKAGKDEYELTAHPYFSNSYVDCDGIEYRVASQDYARLDGMAHYAPGIFNNIEKTLIK